MSSSSCVAVVWHSYLAMALRAHGRGLGWFEGAVGPICGNTRIVVMATAADMVPLTGDNRILTRQGLEVLKHSKPGVRALMEVSGRLTRLSPDHLGFVLGPRINASGRMQSASLALNYLTQDARRALVLAHELERLNAERRDTKRDMGRSAGASGNGNRRRKIQACGRSL